MESGQRGASRVGGVSLRVQHVQTTLAQAVVAQVLWPPAGDSAALLALGPRVFRTCSDGRRIARHHSCAGASTAGAATGEHQHCENIEDMAAAQESMAAASTCFHASEAVGEELFRLAARLNTKRVQYQSSGLYTNPYQKEESSVSAIKDSFLRSRDTRVRLLKKRHLEDRALALCPEVQGGKAKAKARLTRAKPKPRAKASTKASAQC